MQQGVGCRAGQSDTNSKGEAWAASIIAGETRITSSSRSLTAVIASMVVVNLVYGLTLPLLSLVLDGQGISKTVIGLSIMAQASGGIAIASFTPRLIARVGTARLMQTATLLAGITLLSLAVFPHVYAWFPLRFLLGASAAILWSASEAVINEMAIDSWRGRIIGLYAAAGAAGFALGPLILVITGSEGVLPFVVTASLILLAGLPLFWLKAGNRYADQGPPPKLWSVFKMAPEIMLLNFTYAAAVEAILAFFPLFGLHVGLGEARSLALLTAFGVGGVVLQLPLGWLADYVDRRRMLLACVLSTAVGFVLLPELVSTRISAPLFMFALGGVEGMVYAMGVILLGQQFRGVQLATASVVFTTMWGVGAMIGPGFVGAGMDLFGTQVMPYLIAVLYGLYLPILWLGRRRSIVT
ncbi:MAG: MFS transporter [Gammaproteobacteria bacterium]|nr:MFS transporter [Gammaproteobacteria bacterium]